MAFFDTFDRYMFQRINDALNNSYDEPLLISSGDGKQVATTPRRGILSAKMDLIEKPDSFVYNLELPGVQKEDIQVHVENGVLNVSAERKEEKKEGKDRYHYSERRYGSIRRAVSIPEQADPENVKAEFENGVLSLAFSKKPEVSTRKQISIA